MNGESLIVVGLLIGSYLLGAIPFGLLLGLSRGVDIRTCGSGNIGATNLGRALGRRWGIGCFVMDFLKGLVPMLVGRAILLGGEESGRSAEVLMLWLGVGGAAILGHMFPVYLRFRGGKGVATSLGVVMGVWPYFTVTGLISLGVWLMIWGTMRVVSVASILGALAFPIGFCVLVTIIEAWVLAQLWPLAVFCTLVAGMVILRHRSNIVRFFKGQEPQTGGQSEKTS